MKAALSITWKRRYKVIVLQGKKLMSVKKCMVFSQKLSNNNEVYGRNFDLKEIFSRGKGIT